MYSAIVEIRVRHLESPHGKKKKKKVVSFMWQSSNSIDLRTIHNVWVISQKMRTTINIK